MDKVIMVDWIIMGAKLVAPDGAVNGALCRGMQAGDKHPLPVGQNR